MKEVRYLKPKPKFRRVFRPVDLHRVGISYAGPNLVWSPENQFKIVMNNKLSDSLVAKFPAEFAASDVREDEPKPVKQAPVSQTDQVEPDSLPESADPDEIDLDEESTLDEDPDE